MGTCITSPKIIELPENALTDLMKEYKFKSMKRIKYPSPGQEHIMIITDLSGSELVFDARNFTLLPLSRQERTSRGYWKKEVDVTLDWLYDWERVYQITYGSNNPDYNHVFLAFRRQTHDYQKKWINK